MDYVMEDDVEGDDFCLPNTWLGATMLVLSNLSFIPAICMAYQRGIKILVLLYSSVMLISMVYHIADLETIKYSDHHLLRVISEFLRTLKFCDYFAASTALWVTSLWLATPRFSQSWRGWFGIAFISIFITPLVYFNVTTPTIIIPAGAGGIYIIVERGCKYRRTGIKPITLSYCCLGIIPATMCALGGFYFFTVENETNRACYHSLWHVLVGVSLSFIMRKEESDFPLSIILPVILPPIQKGKQMLLPFYFVRQDSRFLPLPVRNERKTQHHKKK